MTFFLNAPHYFPYLIPLLFAACVAFVVRSQLVLTRPVKRSLRDVQRPDYWDDHSYHG